MKTVRIAAVIATGVATTVSAIDFALTPLMHFFALFALFALGANALGLDPGFGKSEKRGGAFASRPVAREGLAGNTLAVDGRPDR